MRRSGLRQARQQRAHLGSWLASDAPGGDEEEEEEEKKRPAPGSAAAGVLVGK